MSTHLGYWATILTDFIENKQTNYNELCKDRNKRKKLYKNLEDYIYNKYKIWINEIYSNTGINYNVIIVRGVPNIDLNFEYRPVLDAESYAFTNRQKKGESIGNMKIQKIEDIIEQLYKNNFEKNIPLLVCGDAYEDVYADIFKQEGYNCFTKNREKLLNEIGYDATILAQIDFILCLYGKKLIGPVDSSLRFASKEARSYINNKNFISKNDWNAVECILPIYTNNIFETLNNNKELFNPLYRS